MSRMYESATGLLPVVNGEIIIVPHGNMKGWVLPGGEFTRFKSVARSVAEELNKLIGSRK